MERKSILIAIIVVALVLGFITELFFFGGSYTLNLGGAAAQVAANVTGTSVFNGTIRTYNPILQMPGNTSQAVVAALRNMQGVKDVRSEANFYIIDTETRDDVYPTALALRAMNVSDILGVANIAIPPELEVATYSGTTNASTMNLNGILQVVTEPYVDSGNEVPVSMTAVVSGGLLIDYYGAHILAERNNVVVNATVSQLANMTFTYAIPWEGRSGIDLGRLNSSGSSYQYKEVNTLLFSPPLTITDVVLKKQLPYISYIDTASADAAANFSDEAAVLADFPSTNVTFPVSTLIVTGNATPVLSGPDGAALDYTPSVSYSYLISLPESAGGYDLGNATSFAMGTAGPLEVGSSVPLNLTVLAIGPNVLSVTPRP